MTWEKKQNDKREGVRLSDGTHTVILHDPEARTPTEHHVIIHLGHDACPACGNPTPKGNLGEIDPHAHVAAVLAALQKSTDDIKAYMRRHGIRERAE